METLNVPTTSISEVKRSPSKIFMLSRDANSGVYVFSHGSVAGVMLAQDQYEYLNKRIDDLEEQLLLKEAAERLRADDGQRFTDREVRGGAASEEHAFDPADGWE